MRLAPSVPALAPERIIVCEHSSVHWPPFLSFFLHRRIRRYRCAHCFSTTLTDKILHLCAPEERLKKEHCPGTTESGRCSLTSVLSFPCETHPRPMRSHRVFQCPNHHLGHLQPLVQGVMHAGPPVAISALWATPHTLQPYCLVTSADTRTENGWPQSLPSCTIPADPVRSR